MAPDDFGTFQLLGDGETDNSARYTAPDQTQENFYARGLLTQQKKRTRTVSFSGQRKGDADSFL
jgi:hypothetical protein